MARGPASGARFIPVPHTGNDSASREEATRVAALIDELLASRPHWVDDQCAMHTLTADDVLVITPYNAQIGAARHRRRPRPRWHRRQAPGPAAPLAIYSMPTSSGDEALRGMEFRYSLNRLNVATSRARCVAAVVASPELLRVHCHTPRQMRLANALARVIEVG